MKSKCPGTILVCRREDFSRAMVGVTKKEPVTGNFECEEAMQQLQSDSGNASYFCAFTGRKIVCLCGEIALPGIFGIRVR